jgi:hypothetical protein
VYYPRCFAAEPSTTCCYCLGRGEEVDEEAEYCFMIEQ